MHNRTNSELDLPKWFIWDWNLEISAQLRQKYKLDHVMTSGESGIISSVKAPTLFVTKLLPIFFLAIRKSTFIWNT